MNFLARIGRSIIVMLPTGVVAFVLMYGAWHWQCNDVSCKAINMIVMITGLVLGIWSLITMAAIFMAGTGVDAPPLGKTLRVNTISILPTVLFYSAFAGAMCYFCFTMFRNHLSDIELKGQKLLFICGLFLPIYELTRIFERKKSIEKPGFSTQLLLHAQSLLTFSGWYYLMLFILKNKNALPSFDKAAKLQYIYLVVAMAIASLILYKCYEWIEKFLGQQGTISWNSKYFGKD